MDDGQLLDRLASLGDGASRYGFKFARGADSLECEFAGEFPPADGGFQPVSIAHAVDETEPPATYPHRGPYNVDDEEHDRFIVRSARTETPAPVVLWANGFGARPEFYGPLLTSIASWGFAVVAAKDSFIGKGTFNRSLAFAEQLARRLPFDPQRVAAVGHSMGGGFAVYECRGDLRDRLQCAVALSPWPGFDWGWFDLDFDRTAEGPPLLALAGGRKDARNSDAEFAAAVRLLGTTHGPVFRGAIREDAGHYEALRPRGSFREPTIAWLRWHLAGDEQARRYFASMRDDRRWSEHYGDD